MKDSFVFEILDKCGQLWFAYMVDEVSTLGVMIQLYFSKVIMILVRVLSVSNVCILALTWPKTRKVEYDGTTSLPRTKTWRLVQDFHVTYGAVFYVIRILLVTTYAHKK